MLLCICYQKESVIFNNCNTSYHTLKAFSKRREELYWALEINIQMLSVMSSKTTDIRPREHNFVELTDFTPLTDASFFNRFYFCLPSFGWIYLWLNKYAYIFVHDLSPPFLWFKENVQYFPSLYVLEYNL